MQVNAFLSVLLAALYLKADAFQVYQSKIPNGDRIPNPCNRSTNWPGVGHQNVFGSGLRNLFGSDFAANDHVWNRTLCAKDSDGDGMTNGQELGDPNCTWTATSTPTFTTNLSHPGVCEPIGSTLCSAINHWLMNCMPRKLNCPAIKKPGVRNYTMRFPITPVPAKETTYMCYRFHLPNDSVSDVIAIEPVVDNARILHHMMLYVCPDEPAGNPADKAFDCGFSSGMSCRSLFGIWGVGIAGQCLNSQLGFRIGPGGFQYAVLQLHWNNPQNITNLTDSSGMRIYHTTQLRPNRGQLMYVGQEYLEIPPNSTDATFAGGCSSTCTMRKRQSIFLTSTYLHMHNLGKSGDIRLIRNGKVVQILDNVTHYDYNNPTLMEYDSPIEVKPGDEILVKCVFQSIGKNSTTYFGEATSDEMCYGFFAYYPLLEGLSICVQWKGIDYCDANSRGEIKSCDFNTFIKLFLLVPKVCAENCTSIPCAVIMDGIEATACRNVSDARSFIYTFASDRGALFEKCVNERSLISTSTAIPSSTASSIGLPASTAQPPVVQGSLCTAQQPQVSHSSAKGDSSLCLVLGITLMACAIHEGIFSSSVIDSN